MKRLIERRLVPLDTELRAGEGEQAGQLVGHAAVFNQWSTIDDWWGEGWDESVAPGAFRKTIKEGDIRALWNHDPNIVLGRNKAGTLELREDETGLLTTITPPDNEWGRPILDAVRRGDVSGMSIAFQVVKESWTRPDKKKEPGARTKRVIQEARLFDVSPVTYPAFPQTDVSARADGAESIAGWSIALGGKGDVLQRAVFLVSAAEQGTVLTAEETSAISEAAGILERYAGEPGAPDEGANHSPTTEPEPASGHHSVEELRRVLELCEMRLRLSGGAHE